MPQWECTIEITETFDGCSEEEARQAFIESIRAADNWLESDIEVNEVTE